MKLFIEENRVLADHIALLQNFKAEHFTFFVLNLNSNRPLDNKQYLLSLLSLAYDLRCLFEKFLSQVVLNLVKDLVVIQVVLKVADLPQEKQLEPLPAVLVLQCLLFHSYQDFREYSAKLVEYSLVETGHGAVVRAFYSSCPQRLR